MGLDSFGQQVTLVAGLVNRRRAKRFLNALAAIKVSELARHTSVVPPDAASLFEVGVVVDALHDAGHWSTIWSQFGPQIPAILCKAMQTEPKIPFVFNPLSGDHFRRNGASDGT